MFGKLGRLTTAHPWAICASWLIVGIVLGHVAPDWDARAQDDDIRFLPERCASVRGYLLLQRAFPQDVFASRAIFAVERPGAPLTEADFALVGHLVNDIQELRQEDPALQIGGVTSFCDGFVGGRLTSVDRHCTLIQVSLGTPFLAVQTRATVDRIETRLRQRLGGNDAPRLLITGPAGLGRDLVRASAEGLEGTTLATVVLVIVVLLLVYRAPLLALVPLVTIAASVWVSLKFLALLTLVPGVHLVNISKVFAVVILYGAGTDYCLFLISRYREELLKTRDGPSAIRRSVRAVGGALAASAGTVVCGLGLMGFAEFAKVRCAGPAIALSLAVALAASLTLTPALLCLLGRSVFWPASGPAGNQVRGREPFWERVSRGVVARPTLVWIGAMLVLLPLVILGIRVRPNYRSTAELTPAAQSIQGVGAIQRHFTAGEIGPLTVLLTSQTDWTGRTGRDVISHLSQGFGRLSNVAEVRSLTQPLGTPLELPSITPARGLLGLLKPFRSGLEELERAGRAAREHYVSRLDDAGDTRFVTRLDVVFRSDPFDRSASDATDLIQTWLREELPRTARGLGGADWEIYGATASARDLAEITEADRARVNLLVLVAIFLILLGLVRRTWLAAYLLATVLFSYYATLGATVLAGMLWSGRPLGLVEWRVPFFLFTILIAVGEDYNIFLVTRLLQERARFGSVEGTRRALARTGGTISSCGLIMAGTFATLMLSGLGTLVQIGFALAFGVLLDTFVVRPFLVPAFALLVWKFTEAPPRTSACLTPQSAAPRRAA